MLSNDLYYSVVRNDEREITRAVNKAFPVLVGHLITTQGACYDDCAESAQITLVHTIEKIRSGAIRDPEKLNVYLLKAAKHNYLRLFSRDKPMVFDETAEYSVEPARQAQKLVSEEKRNILEECLAQLDERNRAFIEYWLRNPGVRSEEVAEVFGSTANAVMQRKYRLVKLLRQCALKKLER